jgi:pimeloyl-ACP methyl ester carboxylesterase
MQRIFMVHGMWCTGAHLARVRHLFERRAYETRAPTLPHHDARDPEGAVRVARIGLDAYVDFLEASLRAEGWDDRPILLGHSLGGLLAQRLAMRVDARALVLLAPVPPSSISSLSWSGFRTIADVVARPAFWRRANRPSARRFRYGIYNALPRDEQDALYPTFCFESGRATLESMLPMLARGDAAAVDPSRVRCPVFVAGGGRDRATPPRIARRIARAYANAEHREYAESSHWMITEPAIERVVDDVDLWLRRAR